MAGHKPDEKGGGLCVEPAPPPHKNFTSTETTAKELTSPSRRSEADRVNGFMAAGSKTIGLANPNGSPQIHGEQ